MRLEQVGKYKIVCGHIYPLEALEVGQQWMSSSHNIVTIESIDKDWITYTWYEEEEKKSHTKDCFSFQCRYCLIIVEGH